MIAPGAKQVIQVIVTRYCDLACSNCTQLIPQQKDRVHMTPAQFRSALESLADWRPGPGNPMRVIGMFGGNPCLHPDFDELCSIFREVIPEKARRGLWSNRLFGHGKAVRETFGYLNLVVHDRAQAAVEMRAELPGAPVHGDGRRAWHSPVLTALRDFVPDEAERWRLIEQCDINRYWSGAITVRRGELRAYFCEVAASMESAYDDADRGVPVTDGWWRLGMDAFQKQAERWCHDCGVPLRFKGHQDTDNTDDVSATHRDLVAKASPRRLVVFHDKPPVERATLATDYLRLRT